jgi:two-component system KDP operon response regulator KdpE
VVDLASGRAQTRFGEVRLAADELRLLTLLADQQGRLVGPGRLAGELGPDRLAASLAGLRDKLEPDPSRPRHLLGGPGTGYRLQAGPPTR